MKKNNNFFTNFHFQVILYTPQHISFAQNGYLYIVESDGKMTNQIREVSTDGTISHYVGAKSKCNCQVRSKVKIKF